MQFRIVPARVAVAALMVSFAAVILAGSARAAIEPMDHFRLDGKREMNHPWGVTVDGVGNVYVADTNRHRIVKFIANRHQALIFGKFGSGDGQLAYPMSVAVEDDLSGQRTLVHVADWGNDRIVTFDDEGNFVRSFGSFGSGNGQLNHPNGIAIVPGYPGGGTYVTEERNNRVSVFTQDGQFSRTFYCLGCPDNQFNVPAGIGVRQASADLFEVYVTETYGGRVDVLNAADGTWVRSFGSAGQQAGQLNFPDEIAVDADGSSWVAESGEPYRVSKFGPAGNYLLSFSQAFNQPHGVALDLQGKIYVANTTENQIDKFREVDGRLFTLIEQTRDYWLDTKGAWFFLSYNGLEQSCEAIGKATIIVDQDDPNSPTFHVEGGPVTLAQTADLKMDLTDKQVVKLAKAWQKGKVSKVLGNFSAKCQDGLRLKKKDEWLQ
ncbi:MAG: hypothetical protein JO056_04305 [Alphaproteobacteria bacterium]|nr:hypothetical protein [Alphaproteobacteria bacterium]